MYEMCHLERRCAGQLCVVYSYTIAEAVTAPLRLHSYNNHHMFCMVIIVGCWNRRGAQTHANYGTVFPPIISASVLTVFLGDSLRPIVADLSLCEGRAVGVHGEAGV